MYIRNRKSAHKMSVKLNSERFLRLKMGQECAENDGQRLVKSWPGQAEGSMCRIDKKNEQ